MSAVVCKYCGELKISRHHRVASGMCRVGPCFSKGVKNMTLCDKLELFQRFHLIITSQINLQSKKNMYHVPICHRRDARRAIPCQRSEKKGQRQKVDFFYEM